MSAAHISAVIFDGTDNDFTSESTPFLDKMDKLNKKLSHSFMRYDNDKCYHII